MADAAAAALLQQHEQQQQQLMQQEQQPRVETLGQAEEREKGKGMQEDEQTQQPKTGTRSSYPTNTKPGAQGPLVPASPALPTPPSGIPGARHTPRSSPSSPFSILPEHLEGSMDRVKKRTAALVGTPKIPNVKWEDVGGLEDVKAAILDTVQVGFLCMIQYNMKQCSMIQYSSHTLESPVSPKANGRTGWWYTLCLWWCTPCVRWCTPCPVVRPLCPLCVVVYPVCDGGVLCSCPCGIASSLHRGFASDPGCSSMGHLAPARYSIRTVCVLYLYTHVLSPRSATL